MLPRSQCSQWDFSQPANCAVMIEEFKTLCLNKVVLKNALKQKEILLKIIFELISRYAAYKQFIWWVFKKLGKGNRGVILLCALRKRRELYPEADGNYAMYLEGKQD